MTRRLMPPAPVTFTVQPAVVHLEEDAHSVGWCYQIMVENHTGCALTIAEASTRVYQGARLVIEESLGPQEIARRTKPAEAARLWFRPEEYAKPHRRTVPPGGKIRWSDNFAVRPRGCGASRVIHTFVFRSSAGRKLRAECVVPLRKNRQMTRLRLPFDGWWQMLIGHEYFEHHMRGGGGMGLDFVALADGGAPHHGDGKALDDWPCYRRQVVAPAGGEIVRVADGHPDSPPGQPLRVPHNGVVIDHGQGEQTFLAHFIPGSIVVSKGERVESGQLLGLCGSSGYSLCPHVHVGLSRRGVGVPILFSDYRVMWPIENEPDRFTLVQAVESGVIRHGAIVCHTPRP